MHPQAHLHMHTMHPPTAHAHGGKRKAKKKKIQDLTYASISLMGKGIEKKSHVEVLLCID